MGISVSQQTMTFLQSLLLGAALGMLYDVFRILRLLIPSGKVISFVEDIVYFLLCGVISCQQRYYPCLSSGRGTFGSRAVLFYTGQIYLPDRGQNHHSD